MSTTYNPFKIALTDGQKKKTSKSLCKKDACWSESQTKLGVVTNFFSMKLKSSD